MGEELTSRGAVDLARAIVEKKVSSQEVVAAYLKRIEEVNPRVNAVVQVAGEEALAEARRADADLAGGKLHGPLHGVPFTAKDVFETAGIVSAAGLEERAFFVPSNDAIVVSRMKAAGAILLGKTNCPPGGGGGDSDNPVYGRTNNPYDLDHSPGGSSGGEAAAIAAGESPLGIGSDSGGSIRVPAHFCGIAALKPTSGRVPNTGVLNHPGGLSDPRSQVGPMARYVRDLHPAFLVIAGEDGIDSGVIPMPFRDPALVEGRGLKAAFYVDDGQASPSAAVVSVVKAAATALAERGAVGSEAQPECLPESRSITERYWELASLTGVEIEQLFSEWDRFRTAMLSFMAGFDAILSPVDSRPAPPHGPGDRWLFNYTLPYSLCGWPCAVVRAGESPEGLPIGVQIAARPWREDIVLALAQQIEDALGGWRPASL